MAAALTLADAVRQHWRTEGSWLTVTIASAPCGGGWSVAVLDNPRLLAQYESPDLGIAVTQALAGYAQFVAARSPSSSLPALFANSGGSAPVAPALRYAVTSLLTTHARWVTTDPWRTLVLRSQVRGAGWQVAVLEQPRLLCEQSSGDLAAVLAGCLAACCARIVAS